MKTIFIDIEKFHKRHPWVLSDPANNDTGFPPRRFATEALATDTYYQSGGVLYRDPSIKHTQPFELPDYNHKVMSGQIRPI
jgi:hypothetical protein